jgi:HSP20 family protein
MVISRWDPWGELAALQRDVQELFGRTSGTSAGTTRRAGSLVPPMDAFRTEDGALVIRLEVPGISPDDLDVSLNRGVLTISGQRKLDDEVSGDNWLRRERAVGSFSRSVSLSDTVDPSSITTSFEHGVLELRVPPAPEEQPTRIKIAGQDQAQAIDVESRSSTGGDQDAPLMGS